jgi:hypothetical protein
MRTERRRRRGVEVRRSRRLTPAGGEPRQPALQRCYLSQAGKSDGSGVGSRVISPDITADDEQSSTPPRNRRPVGAHNRAVLARLVALNWRRSGRAFGAQKSSAYRQMW